MLKQLQLFNFQAHKRLKIEFPPGITTIKGPSDVGKSSILRAIRLLALNDISGEDFISWGEEEAVVILHVDGRKIVRRKGKENIYKLDGEVFKSFRDGVPDTIAALLKMCDINFQKQHDSPFWLSSSAPEVSRQLNRVIDLSVIDSSISNAGKLVRTAREKVVVTEDRLGEKLSKLTELKDGTKRIEQFKLLREKFIEHEKVEQDHSRLEGMLKSMDSHNLGELQRREAALAALLQKATALREVQSKHDRLESLLADLEEADESVLEVPDFGPVERAWKNLASISQQHSRLSSLFEQMEEAQKEASSLKKAADQFHGRLAKISCPLCGRRDDL